MIDCEITIINKLGLHARAAAKLASAAGRYGCTLKIGHNSEQMIDAKSVMSLMLLAASQGTTLHFHFDGEDEAEAEIAIKELIANRFGEDQ